MSFCPAGGDLYRHVERCRTGFFELREEFNYILISALPATERKATLMGQLADGIISIVEANQIMSEVFRRAKQQLENSQVQLLGDISRQSRIRKHPEEEHEPRWA